jgi:hypothetical protein
MPGFAAYGQCSYNLPYIIVQAKLTVLCLYREKIHGIYRFNFSHLIQYG